jgi:glycosyltransferase involved in cell wall biosynthesis
MGPSTKIAKGIAQIRPTLDALPVRCYQHHTKTPFSPAWLPFSNTVHRINELNPDVVHLHWVAGGMMRIEDIARIKAPIVWSLHDNWPFTGGCHIKWECNKYKRECGSCPRLGSKRENDLSRKVFNRKKKAFQKIPNLTVVGLSKWIHRLSEDSRLFSGRRNVCLPNPIDASTFSPFEREKARDLLKLPQHKRLILFGAMSATSDINKGYKELCEALSELKTENAELVVFGASRPEQGSTFPQKAHYLGRLHDDVTLRVLYSAVDVMVVPSIQENLSNAIMESLACATPVVGFEVGGNSDLVNHQMNGYLSKPSHVSDLARGIEWVLNHNDYAQLAFNARQKVLDNFDNQVVVPRYIELYRSVLEKEV